MSKPLHKEYEQILNESQQEIKSIKLSKKIKNKEGKYLVQETLALLRALSWLHQTLHWKSRGENYHFHLLYERLYNNTIEEIDQFAEKLVGLYGNDAMNSVEQITMSQQWLQGWENDNLETAIKAELEFQHMLFLTYTTLKQAGELTLGMDDLLMTLAGNHDSHLYLLRNKD